VIIVIRDYNLMSISQVRREYTGSVVRQWGEVMESEFGVRGNGRLTPREAIPGVTRIAGSSLWRVTTSRATLRRWSR
jgi:hypothetical protein